MSAKRMPLAEALAYSASLQADSARRGLPTVADELHAAGAPVAEQPSLERRLAVAEARAAYWHAMWLLDAMRDCDGCVIECRATDEHRRAVSVAESMLASLGEQP